MNNYVSFNRYNVYSFEELSNRAEYIITNHSMPYPRFQCSLKGLFTKTVLTAVSQDTVVDRSVVLNDAKENGITVFADPAKRLFYFVLTFEQCLDWIDRMDNYEIPYTVDPQIPVNDEIVRCEYV